MGGTPAGEERVDTGPEQAVRDARLPLVTVVMPVRNEAAFIARSLSAVLAQDYPADRLEVIVADGMSTDATRDIVRALQVQCAILRLVDNPSRIVSTGLNTALKDARGDVVVRVDGHCEIEPRYVRRCVELLQQERVDGVGGRWETVGETEPARAIALAMSSPFGVGDAAFRSAKHGAMLVDTVPFPAYRRAVVERAGPFDEELVRNQDDEFNYRLRKLGGRLLLTTDVQARYYCRGSLGLLWRQYFQYGFWKVRVVQKHPWQMRPRQLVPPAFVATVVGSAGLAPFSRLARAVLPLVVGTYAGTSLIASLWTARQGSWRQLPLLPLAFAALHLSYGLGFLVGLVRFWKRWTSNGQA